MTSVIGNKNSSLGHAILRSQKSMQTPIFSFFKNGHNISKPVWVLFFSNKAAFNEFVKFDFDCLYNVEPKLSLLLLNRFSVRFDIKTIHGYLRVKTGHVFIAPSKDVYIFFYKRYKVLLLYR